MLRSMLTLVLLAAPAAASAVQVELLQNGSFEDPVVDPGARGSLSVPPWTFTTRAEGDGGPVLISGQWYGEWSFGALGFFPNGDQGFPSAGNQYGTFHPDGRGDYVMIQSFTVPANATSVVASIDVLRWAGLDAGGGACDFYGSLSNAAGCEAVVNGGLNPDATTGARVDVIAGDAFALAGLDAVLAQVVAQSSQQTDSSYSTYSTDLTGLVTPGQTYQYRIALSLRSGRLLTFDNASVLAVPEPPRALLLALALGALRLYRQR